MGALSGQTALVTGASSGIGFELAIVLAEAGAGLVLVARDRKRLEALAETIQQRYAVSARIIAKDLALSNTPDEIFQELQAAGIAVDVLVNNAGFGLHGFFAEVDMAEQLRMVQVNVTALTHLTRLFLPGMLQRRKGSILNVASTAAFQPGPVMAVYYATKAYVLFLSEALSNETQGRGVTVTALCPGPTTTEFQQRAGVGHTKLMQGRIMDAKTVAHAGLRGMLSGQSLVIPGFRNRLIALTVRFFPRKFVAKAVRSMQDARERR